MGPASGAFAAASNGDVAASIVPDVPIGPAASWVEAGATAGWYRLADAVVGNSEAWLSELSTDQLRELVVLEDPE